MPLSRTENLSLMASVKCSSIATVTRTSPQSVNLIALLTRLMENLAETQRITNQIGAGFVLRGDQKLKVLVLELSEQTMFERLSSKIFKPEFRLLHTQLARFNFREV